MPELTLESLAARVEALEQAAKERILRRGRHTFVIKPGTGDWDAFQRAADALRESTYDFDALADLDRASMIGLTEGGK